MSELQRDINARRTFAIISHPDAGKTTMTEKLLLLGQAIQVAGSVKGKKGPHATSDWMALEQERGISVTSSVMQFPYRDRWVNLLDTPGHEDFSEDTYRTLTAVDSALMVIDGAKGVEDRTIKLMNVCRLRDTPIMTFVNKLDRDSRDAIELMDEVETVLEIRCAPITWPIGSGRDFKGVYHLLDDTINLFSPQHRGQIRRGEMLRGLDDPALETHLGHQADELRESIELVRGASHEFDVDEYRKGTLTPVFFGSALNNFGVEELLDEFDAWRAGAIRLLERQGEKPPERDLLVSLGTGTSMLLVEPGRANRVGGTALGGGTLLGLGAMWLVLDAWDLAPFAMEVTLARLLPNAADASTADADDGSQMPASSKAKAAKKTS